VFTLTLLSVVAISAQTPPPRRAPATNAGTVVISGHVVADATGEPIRNARVTLSPASQGTSVVLTDAAGAFQFRATKGRYGIVAGKTGYARAGATVQDADGAVELRLKKAASVAGRIVDERGDPVVGVQVSASTHSGAGNSPTSAATTDTDDRGEYRLDGLSDGSFIVGVTTLAAVGPSSNPSASRADPRTTYYPGTMTVGEAQALSLQAGEQRRGIDIVIPAERLAGTPGALFDDRFLPRPEPLPVRLGIETPERRPTGALRGRVVSSDGTPISFAHVYLFASAKADSGMVTTDVDGRFEFEAIPAGPLLISVTRQGYTQVESGHALKPFPVGRATSSPTPNDVQFGRRFDLAANSTETVNLQMARWSTLSGTITDENGDPIQGVGVEVLAVQYDAGRRRLVPAGPSRLTDDLGKYRLYGLAAGTYLVSAAVGHVSTDDLPGYGRAYFPGTPNPAEAQYVSVGLAQDIGFVDFAMPRTRTARVTGIVLGPRGERSAPGSLTLAPSQHSSSVIGVTVGARIAPDGSFVFPNVPRGEYVIQAYRGRLNAHTEGEFGAVLVSVDAADVSGVIVRTSSGSSVTGRFRFDIDDPRTSPKPSDFELSAPAADFDMSPPSNPASADIHTDWTFEMSGLNGPRRLQLIRTPPGLALEEIRVNGADVTDRPIPLGTRAQSLANVEVVITDRVTDLSGTVVDDRARPVGGAMIIVFSSDRQQWYPASRYLRRATAVQDGAFALTGIAPGRYFVSAVTAIPAGAGDAWQDPQFLESLIPGASTIDVGREKAALTLRLRIHSR
jgi:protocatechuate 3,4-dioxygenase beta subunit